MDFLKLFGLQGMIMFIPGILIQFGQSLKNKDDNTTGNDDAGGNILIALAPVIPAFLGSNQPILRRSLLAAYNTIGGYFGFPPQSLPESVPNLPAHPA